MITLSNSILDVRRELKALIHSHGPAVLACVILWLCFAFVETLKTLYFAYNKTLILQYAVHSLFIFVPWIGISLVCGMVSSATRNQSFTHPRFIAVHLCLALILAFTHVFLLTLSYKIFLPRMMEQTTIGNEFQRLTVLWMQYELLAYFSVLLIWRLRFQSQSSHLKPVPAARETASQHASQPTRAGHKPNSISLHCNGSLIEVKLAEIEWLFADNNYTFVHLSNRRLRVRSSIQTLLNSLHQAGSDLSDDSGSPVRFFQTHRSAVINLALLQQLNKTRVIMQSGARVPVSRRRFSRLEEEIKNLS